MEKETPLMNIYYFEDVTISLDYGKQAVNYGYGMESLSLTFILNLE